MDGSKLITGTSDGQNVERDERLEQLKKVMPKYYRNAYRDNYGIIRVPADEKAPVWMTRIRGTRLVDWENQPLK